MTRLIGITAISRTEVSPVVPAAPHVTLNEAYVGLCEEVGAVPVVLTPVGDVAALLDRLDGVILSGGGDVDPQRYGGEVDASTQALDRDRDSFEFDLVAIARRRRIPLLAVCRGMHLVNVAFGGTLKHDIAGQGTIEHYRAGEWNRAVHRVALTPDSAIGAALRSREIEVNSCHHQAIDRLGKGLRAVGHSEDGTVEAIEARAEPVVGIQWHPEWTTGTAFAQQCRIVAHALGGVGERQLAAGTR